MSSPRTPDEDSNGYFSCRFKVSSVVIGQITYAETSDYYWVVPKEQSPSKFTFDITTYEADGYLFADGGNQIYFSVTGLNPYTNPDNTDSVLPLNQDVWRYFTRTSDDGRKQRLRFKQRRMCFNRAEFDESKLCIHNENRRLLRGSA
jgi:hypothetical protein